MNKKHLVLIVVVTALISTIATTVAFTFMQLPTKNGNTTLSTPSPISSLPSTSQQVQSLTPDEIATLKADSFEIELKDNYQSTSNDQMDFNRIDNNLWNSTLIAEATVRFANYTSVSETTFLSVITHYAVDGQGYEIHFNVDRISNTFYLTINNYDYPQSDTSVYCVP